MASTKVKKVKQINMNRIYYNEDDGVHIFRVYKKGNKPMYFRSTVYENAKLDAWTYAMTERSGSKRSYYGYRGSSVSIFMTAEEAEYILDHIRDKPYYPDTKEKLEDLINKSYKKQRENDGQRRT